MGSFCRDINIIFIGFGAILFILLGLFSFIQFETLEIHGKKWGKGSFSTQPLILLLNSGYQVGYIQHFFVFFYTSITIERLLAQFQLR